MPPQFSEPWDRITRIHLTHHPKSRDGSSMSQIEIRGDHPREGEEGHHTPQDRPREEGVEVEGEEEHFHYPDTHLPSQLKNF